MPQRGGMRHYSQQNQQIPSGGNSNSFSEANVVANNNNQIQQSATMNQGLPPHQGQSQHQVLYNVKLTRSSQK